MISVDDHLQRILGTIAPLPSLELPLLDALGCLLDEDLVGERDLPAFDNSAMDGYAVRLADVEGATPQYPVVLTVIEDIPAGAVGQRTLTPGNCARIMTGAPVPAGAEAVVPVEWTDAGTTTVRIARPASPGQHIRRRGEDVSAGEVLLAPGTWLGAPQVGLAAAAGRDRLRVHPRPRVVVLSTGSELVEPGLPLGPGQIHESNSFTLTAAVREAGAVAYRVGIVPDEPKKLMDAIEDQLVRSDVIITSGGVSAGAYDVVKQVLGQLGTVSFDQVAMQPGKPQGFGLIGPDRTPIFTLPGNPVSAYVSFEVFVRPALRRMMGLDQIYRPFIKAVVGRPLMSARGKRQFTRAWYERSGGESYVRPVGGHGSHLMGDLAHANALVVLPEDVEEVPMGATVDVMLLEHTKH